MSKTKTMPKTSAEIMQEKIDKVEKELIEQALIKCKYNRVNTAADLNWSRRTLYNKMKKHGL